MVKINEFHVGKNDVNWRGDWTLIGPEKEKNRKKVVFFRIWTQDHWIHRPKLSHWATRLHLNWLRNCKTKNHLLRSVHCWFLLRFLVPKISVLAIFSQFPPLCATLHLYRTILDLLPLLFFLYNFLVVPCGPFENFLFWLYFWGPCMNLIFSCEGQIHFFYIFAIYFDFFCIFVQSLEKKSHRTNMGFGPKSCVNF